MPSIFIKERRMAENPVYKRAWNFLGSRNLSVFIFIMGMTYTLFLVIFSMVVPLPWVANISRLLPFKVLYLLFFINIVICEIKWIPVIVRRCRKPKMPERPEDLERFGHKITVSREPSAVCRLERYLRRRGYKIQGSGIWGQGSENPSPVLLYAYKGRFSPIGNLVFHAAFLFLLAAVAVSMFFRFEGSARVTEGYQFSGLPQEYVMISASPLASLPQVSFFLEKITPRFWEDKLLFTELKADVRYQGGEGSVWMSSPLKIGGARITINGISLTPMYTLKDSEGKVLDEGYVNLAVFAPGTEDHFQIPGFPHQIFVSFYPDFAMEGGKPVNRSMDTNNPRFFLRVFRGRMPVFSGFLRLGEEGRFESLSLSFPEFRYWGDFRIVRDPGFMYIWIAFVLFVTGLVWKLLFYRREVFVAREGEVLYLYGSSDYYHRLFENRLRMLAGE